MLATTPDVDVEALEAELDSARDALRAQKDVVDETLADAANARALASRCVAALEKRNLLEYDANEPEPPPLVDSTQSGGEKRNELGETNEPRESFSSVVPGELVTAAEVNALSAAEATHASVSFTRVAATDDVLAAFHAHCETCGSAMERNARARLIGNRRDATGHRRRERRCAALEEIAIRTEKPFVRLFGACRALPARHAACLAESARRAAYAERLAARARRVADLFAADEKEERDRREGVPERDRRFVCERRRASALSCAGARRGGARDAGLGDAGAVGGDHRAGRPARAGRPGRRAAGVFSRRRTRRGVRRVALLIRRRSALKSRSSTHTPYTSPSPLKLLLYDSWRDVYPPSHSQLAELRVELVFVRKAHQVRRARPAPRPRARGG